MSDDETLSSSLVFIENLGFFLQIFFFFGALFWLAIVVFADCCSFDFRHILIYLHLHFGLVCLAMNSMLISFLVLVHVFGSTNAETCPQELEPLQNVVDGTVLAWPGAGGFNIVEIERNDTVTCGSEMVVSFDADFGVDSYITLRSILKQIPEVVELPIVELLPNGIRVRVPNMLPNLWAPYIRQRAIFVVVITKKYYTIAPGHSDPFVSEPMALACCPGEHFCECERGGGKCMSPTSDCVEGECIPRQVPAPCDANSSFSDTCSLPSVQSDQSFHPTSLACIDGRCVCRNQKDLIAAAYIQCDWKGLDYTDLFSNDWMILGRDWKCRNLFDRRQCIRRVFGQCFQPKVDDFVCENATERARLQEVGCAACEETFRDRPRDARDVVPHLVNATIMVIFGGGFVWGLLSAFTYIVICILKILFALKRRLFPRHPEYTNVRRVPAAAPIRRLPQVVRAEDDSLE